MSGIVDLEHLQVEDPAVPTLLLEDPTLRLARHPLKLEAKFPKPLPMGTARRLPRAVFSERLITSFICRSLTRDYKVYILLQLLLLGEVLVS